MYVCVHNVCMYVYIMYVCMSCTGCSVSGALYYGTGTKCWCDVNVIVTG